MEVGPSDEQKIQLIPLNKSIVRRLEGQRRNQPSGSILVQGDECDGADTAKHGSEDPPSERDVPQA